MELGGGSRGPPSAPPRTIVTLAHYHLGGLLVYDNFLERPLVQAAEGWGKAILAFHGPVGAKDCREGDSVVVVAVR